MREMPTTSRIEQLREKVRHFQQSHIFRFWDELTDLSKNKLITQIETIDFELMKNLKEKYLDAKQPETSFPQLEPAPVIPLPSSKEEKKRAEQARQLGEKLIAAGKVAVLLVAGGQGTRLGFNGPKGMFKVGPLSGKSLFQLHAEKIKALTIKYKVNLPWFIMTSQENFDQTQRFFEQANFFGLSATDVILFPQKMIPALDENGKFLLDQKDHIFCNPNGHGGVLQALRENFCLQEMQQRGIEHIFYFQVDNVLINICDPYFIGYHALSSAEMSSKVVAKREPTEKVGIIGLVAGKISVIEYSDMPEDALLARNPDGQLKYHSGSIAIHLLTREFAERMTASDLAFPYHRAFKKIPFIDESGKLIEPEAPNGYKFEMFIFDALPFTRNSITMEIAREDEFSPVKNAVGSDSPTTAQQDLMNYHGRMLRQAGFAVPFDDHNNLIGKLEICPLFALTADDLKMKLDKNFKFNGNLLLE